MEEDASGRQAGRATWLCVALSAVFSFVVLVLPARGLTFLRDDWMVLGELVAGKRPGTWLSANDEHAVPVSRALLDLEHVLFGGNHTFYLCGNWLAHVATLVVLARLLLVRTRDDHASAIAVATFGLATTWRQVLWSAAMLPSIVSTGLFLATLLLIERLRASASERWLPAVAASVVVTSLSGGVGFVVGPVAIVEVWATFGERRRVRIAVLAAATALAFVGFAHAGAAGHAGGVLPRAPGEALEAVVCFLELVGLGFVKQVPLLPLSDGAFVGVGLALAYLALATALATRLPSEERRRFALDHVVLGLVLGPIALARWRYALVQGVVHLPSAHSYFQYWLALGWVPAWSVVVRAALARWGSRARAALVGGLVLLAIGHATVALEDDALVHASPIARRALHHREIVDRLVAAVESAHGPVYDAGFPTTFAWKCTGARNVVEVVAPDVARAANWTDTATPESLAPLASDSLLNAFCRPRDP